MSEFVNTVDVVGDNALTDSIIDRSVTEISDNAVTSVGIYAFGNCSSLTTADFPAATSVDGNAFNNCAALTTVNIPMATSIGVQAFRYCSNLTSVTVDSVTTLNSYAFGGCELLTTIDLPAVATITNSAFEGCSALTAVIIRKGDKVCRSSNVNNFYNTPIASGTGYIYVPRALLSDTDSTKDYRRATNWSAFEAQFRALEDYTVDGTTTGELDPTKI